MNQLKKVSTGTDVAFLAGKDSGSGTNTQSAVAYPKRICLCGGHGRLDSHRGGIS